MVFWNKDVLFCEIHPIFYEISTQKEIVKRHVKNFKEKPPFASSKSTDVLPNLVSAHSSKLIKTGKGIDPVLQENKAHNIELASSKMNHLIIEPGEEFSFWDIIGRISRLRGFKAGRVINGDKVEAGLGGGLCNLANSLHLLILHSPLDVTEFHSHSDALAPDGPVRKPFATGTSVVYNYLDYRFRNNTDQTVQLLFWCEDGYSYGELRSNTPYEFEYQLVEENHHFKKIGDKFYRFSKIYREKIEKETDNIVEHKLVLDNKSEVMFDYEQIPKDLIRK